MGPSTKARKTFAELVLISPTCWHPLKRMLQTAVLIVLQEPGPEAMKSKVPEDKVPAVIMHFANYC